jgi:hypothetical protein
MSAADFLTGCAVGASAVIAILVTGAAAVVKHGREVDEFFNRITDPVPSNVRIMRELTP